MTQSNEEFVETHSHKTNDNNREPAPQSIELNPIKKTSYDRFVNHYAKFMIVADTAGQLLFYMQAYTIFMTKSANNVSLQGFLMPCFSLSAWLIYGFLISDKVVIFTNIVGVIGAFMVVAAILKFS